MGKKGKAKGRHRAKHADAALTEHHPAAGADDADGATELAASLVSVAAQLQRRLGHGADEDGLTRSRLSALGRLILGGPCTLGELAAREGVRPPTMTRLVHSMEAAGLVAREPHPTDGRMIVLRATPAGQAILDRGQQTRLAPLADAIAGLERDERRELERASTILGRFLREGPRDGPRAHRRDRGLRLGGG